MNIPYIFYQDETNLDLKGARRIGLAAWVSMPPTGPIDGSGDTGFFIDAVIRPANDRIFVSYQNARTDVFSRADLHMAIIDELSDPESEVVLSCSGGILILPCAQQILPGDYGYYSSITLTAAGLPAIAHYDNANGVLLLERRTIDGLLPPGSNPADVWDLKRQPDRSGNSSCNR